MTFRMAPTLAMPLSTSFLALLSCASFRPTKADSMISLPTCKAALLNVSPPAIPLNAPTNLCNLPMLLSKESKHRSTNFATLLCSCLQHGRQGRERRADADHLHMYSMLMDEYKPLLFHSDGPMKGLPMPFPAPDNAQRALRSMAQLRKGLHTSKPLSSTTRPALYAPVKDDPFLMR